MRSVRTLANALLSSILLFGVFAAASLAGGVAPGQIKHVLLFSVDGLHDTDLVAFVAAHAELALINKSSTI